MTLQLKMIIILFHFHVCCYLPLKDFLTSISTVIKIFQCSVLNFEMYINSLNEECNDQSENIYYILFIQTKIN